MKLKYEILSTRIAYNKMLAAKYKYKLLKASRKVEKLQFYRDEVLK